MNNSKCLAVLIFSVLISTVCWADPFPEIKVIPWNGHRAATSLTFDDGDSSHLDVAIPELNQRKMHATFYLIANRIDRKDEWRKILPAGHEIGNHTLDHKHVSELTPKDEEAQVVGAQNVLQKEFGVPVLTFAYPFTEVSLGLKKWVEKTNFIARNGYGAYVIKPDTEPDWMNIPSRMTMSNLTFETYKSWIDDDVDGGGWLVWMIHGLEGTASGWQPIFKKTFTQILDCIQTKDIWVGTFMEVGAYFRAQKVFEKITPEMNSKEKKWKWEVPANFPAGVVLKVQLNGGEGSATGVDVLQGKQKITPDEKNIYVIDFGKKELTVHLLAATQSLPEK
jgi:peptidoglycan/xylan/chitin deacetylase (PgdA/CDA1 family)